MTLDKATVILGKNDICKDCIKADVCKHKANLDKDPIIGVSIEQCEHFKDRSKFIELPCKVGDYLEWDDGDGVPLYFEVLGFRFNMLGEISRFITKDLQPIISHSSIKRILTKEEAEQVLNKNNIKEK